MDADEMTDQRPAAESDEGYAALVVSPAVAPDRAHARRAVTVEPRPPAAEEPASTIDRTEREPAAEADMDQVAPPDVTDQPAGPRRRWTGLTWPTAIAAALVVLLLAAVAGASVTAVRLRDASASQRARVDALAAARSHAQAILSYDHRTLDADFARAQQVITGPFQAEYEKTTSAVVRPTALEYKAVVKAEVTSAGVVRASSDRVVVLLFVDQTTTSTRLAKPKRDASRVRMTLVKAGGRWLVSDVDAL